MKILQPPDWMAPRGYSNGILAEMTVGSKLVFVGGQVGWNGQQQFESDDLADQVRQTLANIVAILAEGGAAGAHRAHDLVRHRQERIRGGLSGHRQALPRTDRPAFPGHDGG